MKWSTRWSLVAAGAVIAIAQASAAPLALNPGNADWTTSINSNLSTAELAAITGISATSLQTLFYKQNVGEGSDTGTFASSYMTEFFNSPSDPQDATMTYVGGPSIACGICILIIKDGNQNPAQYLFDLGTTGFNWNGTDQIVMTGFWPQQGSISHVEIRGTPGIPRCSPTDCGSSEAPEPGSVALLGLGLALVGVLRRRRKTH